MSFEPEFLDSSSALASRVLPRHVLTDGHVHFHDCFDRFSFLTAAARNLERGGRELDLAGPFLGCLLFSESASDHYFHEFWSAAGDPLSDAEWRFERTQEDCSLFARDRQDFTLLLVAGRQIVTAENLEVLAIGTVVDIADGKPIRDVLSEVEGAGALAILPWGFGKWWLGRGRIVEDIVADPPKGGTLFLGDNGGRLRGTPRPPAFAKGESRGIYVLPGSDPLPFPRHGSSAGGYGFVVEAPLDPDHPAATLKDALRRLEHPPAVFGSRESLVGFCVSQIAMQMRKRRKSSGRNR